MRREKEAAEETPFFGSAGGILQFNAGHGFEPARGGGIDMTEQEIWAVIAGELAVTPGQVERTVGLLDEGNTIPFIARYRKEVTGNLDEETLRSLAERLNYLRNLSRRKEEVLRLIAEQGKLTPELEKKIREAKILQVVEDLYLPFRPKRQTRAAKARAKGLEPLARLLFTHQTAGLNLDVEAGKYIDPGKELPGVEEVLQGVRDIIAEWVAEDAEIRQAARTLYWEKGILVSQALTEEQTVYETYYNYREAVAKMPPHRFLAINRGEKEKILKVTILAPDEEILGILRKKYLSGPDFPGREHVAAALEDSYKRLLQPAMEREIRSQLWETAEEHAVKVFAANLKKLLLQPPVRGKTVLGIDPGYRTGSKVAVVDRTGRLLATETVYPHAPQNRWEQALTVLEGLVKQYRVDVIAIGNGTACRETEKLVTELIEKTGDRLQYIVVDEAGASVYSASPLAKAELPGLDVSLRGAVSIARRLQDPLAELVKIDPRSIGVGLYQHDVSPARLKEKLEQVVESCVNHVGVDVNTASPALLRYVAGLNARTAAAVVAHRETVGEFKKREELLLVKGFGEKTFRQAAGFLRLYSSEDPLARTPIHPESYRPAAEVMGLLGYSPSDLENREKLHSLRQSLEKLSPAELAGRLEIGLPTLTDIIEALKKPGRDPREDLPPPVFRRGIISLENLREGMILKGTVRNVVDFGAFVDIGVEEDGLVHISEMSREFVKDPLAVVSAGKIVEVMVLKVDLERKRIALSMKLPAAGEESKGVF